MGGGCQVWEDRRRVLSFWRILRVFFFGGGLLLIQSLTVTQNPPASAS